MYPVDSGDTTFIVLCTALVLLMTPGLAFFYGGMVRAKNVLTIMMQSFMSMGIIAVIWIFGGFSLAYGPDIGGLFGSLSYHFALDNVGAEPSPVYAPTVPFILFFAYQLMFAIITPALITGAPVGRFNTRGYIQFLILWMILVYIPVCHWIWGGGFLSRLGVADFAGGIVIHVSAGFAALSTVLFFGPRRKELRRIEPSNLPLMAAGAGLLWFGWFGFNAGGAYAGDALAAYAATNTTIAGSVAMTVWLILDWHDAKRPSFSGILVGAVAGLATITPCAGYVPPWAAILIGAIGSAVCYYAKGIQSYFKFDDALEVFRAHGMGGVTGGLLVGVFASTAINNVGAGLHQFCVQLLGVTVVGAYSFGVTWIILRIIRQFGPIRVSDEELRKGLDESLYGERAYETMNLPGSAAGCPRDEAGAGMAAEGIRTAETPGDARADAPDTTDGRAGQRSGGAEQARPGDKAREGEPPRAGRAGGRGRPAPGEDQRPDA
ncbi:MAG: ammonium transporter [Desulfovibrionaceae bacterium]|nr:ammonium transporter [Desulfovibrionaceae bacterium]